MDEAARNDSTLVDEEPIKVSAAYEGNPGDIARAREVARTFSVRLQSVHRFPVSTRAMEIIQLVVSELLTNACKYAPGPCLLDLEVSGVRVAVTVWDSDPTLPLAAAAGPGRVGRHGLEIVMAVCQSFEVHREPVGKRATAVVLLADDPGGGPAGHDP